MFTAEETADANPRGSVNAESRRGGRKEAQEREWARAALLAAPQAVSGPGCSGRTSDTHAADRRGRHLSSISRGLSAAFRHKGTHVRHVCCEADWQGANCFPWDRVCSTSQHPHFSLLLLHFAHGLVHSTSEIWLILLRRK